jgi:hypothetical protein
MPPECRAAASHGAHALLTPRSRLSWSAAAVHRAETFGVKEGNYRFTLLVDGQFGG